MLWFGPEEAGDAAPAGDFAAATTTPQNATTTTTQTAGAAADRDDDSSSDSSAGAGRRRRTPDRTRSRTAHRTRARSHSMRRPGAAAADGATDGETRPASAFSSFNRLRTLTADEADELRTFVRTSPKQVHAKDALLRRPPREDRAAAAAAPGAQWADRHELYNQLWDYVEATPRAHEVVSGIRHKNLNKPDPELQEPVRA